MKQHIAPVKAVAAVDMDEVVAAGAAQVVATVTVAIIRMKQKAEREGAADMAALAPAASAFVPAVGKNSPMKKASPVWETTALVVAGGWSGRN